MHFSLSQLTNRGLPFLVQYNVFISFKYIIANPHVPFNLLIVFLIAFSTLSHILNSYANWFTITSVSVWDLKLYPLFKRLFVSKYFNNIFLSFRREIK